MGNLSSKLRKTIINKIVNKLKKKKEIKLNFYEQLKQKQL